MNTLSYAIPNAKPPPAADAASTGKVTVALRLAQILHGLGYCRKGYLVAVTRDDLVVILAGYKDRINAFFQSNPGMNSRIRTAAPQNRTRLPSACCTR